jgi:hypothetical protein
MTTETTPFEGKPDFINEKGVKWWLDKQLTNYCEREDLNGIKLKMKVFYVEEPDGRKTRMLIDANGPVYENQKLEDMAVHIDILKLMESKNAA